MASHIEIPRSYEFGFVLTEQELRRISSSCRVQLAKLSDQIEEKFVAKLRDHSLIESDSLDDILSLENGGAKSIEQLELLFISTAESRQSIFIRFRNALVDRSSWHSIQMKILSTDRDWAFLVASELEDRITKLRLFSLPHWWSESFAGGIAYGVMFALLLWLYYAAITPAFLDEVSKPAGLRAAYEAGTVTNPIEAMIFLEEVKSERHTGWLLLGFFVLMLTVPTGVNRILGKLMLRAYAPYVFNWGDQVEKHIREMGRVKTLAVTVGLGLMVSIVAGIATKLIWP